MLELWKRWTKVLSFVRAWVLDSPSARPHALLLAGMIARRQGAIVS